MNFITMEVFIIKQMVKDMMVIQERLILIMMKKKKIVNLTFRLTKTTSLQNAINSQIENIILVLFVITYLINNINVKSSIIISTILIILMIDIKINNLKMIILTTTKRNPISLITKIMEITISINNTSTSENNQDKN